MTIYSSSIPRRAALLALSLSTLLLYGCGRGSDANERVVEMGTTVAVGTLSYTVIDLSWRDSLPSGGAPRMPQNKYLVLNVSVTNGGAGQASIPLLTIVNSDGTEFPEQQRGEGVPKWLGMIRSVSPAQTEQGNILFDAPPGAYKLRVSSGGDAENEQTALVTIPFRVDAPSTAERDPMDLPRSH